MFIKNHGFHPVGESGDSRFWICGFGLHSFYKVEGSFFCMGKWHASDWEIAEWNISFEEKIVLCDDLPWKCKDELSGLVDHMKESPWSSDVEGLAHKPIFTIGDISGQSIAEVAKKYGIKYLPSYFY